jgi:hypothetical protein
VRVTPPVEVAPVALSGLPGKVDAVVRLRNRSNRPKKVRLKVAVPAAWRATPTERQIALAPSAETETRIAVEWNTDWQPKEIAAVEVLGETGKTLARAGMIPSTIPLPRAANIVCDGSLADWPARARLPEWALGCKTGPANVEAYAGYSPAGPHFAFVVRDSRAQVTDPKLFWLQDVVEVFVDATGDKRPRKRFAPTDHQFWLCPLVDQQRASVGRWKRFEEIPATVYDLPGVKSFAAKRGDGYVLEATLPASALRGFHPRPGARIGLSLHLSIHGREENRQVFWPRPKDWSTLNMPNAWGAAILE